MTTTTRKTNKATHTGHCQGCGAVQKLPAGVLAKHGYTTKWGFFSGVCNGSGYLPFELDCSLIESMIRAAAGQAAALRSRAAAVRLEADPESVWVHHYSNQTWRYRWAKARLTLDAGIMRYTVLDGPDGDRKPNRVAAGVPYDLTAAAAHENASYADHLEREAKQIDGYISWQRERLAAWAPAELTPIK